MNTAADDWHRGSRVFDGQFLIEEFLGNGGRGAVWLLRDLSIGHLYAVKTAIVESANKHHFLEELEAWKNVPQHPNLTRCYFSRALRNGMIAIFSEYVGEFGLTSLRQRLDAGGLGDTESIIRCAIGFGRGLGAIHRLGWIHGDFTPRNILIGIDGTPKVSDFGQAIQNQGGIRKATPETHGRSRSHGTPAYKSSEQADDSGTISTKTDIWSFGICLLEMFIGECTWLTGLAAPHVLASIVENRARKKPRIDIPLQVAELIARCFSVEGAWDSIGHVVRELGEIAGFKEERVAEGIENSPSVSVGVSKRPTPTLGTVTLYSVEQSLGDLFARHNVPFSEQERAVQPLAEQRAQVINAIRRFEKAIEYAHTVAVDITDEGRRLLVNDLKLRQAHWYELSNDIPGALELYAYVINSLRCSPSQASSKASMLQEACAQAESAQIFQVWHGRAAEALDAYSRASTLLTELVAAEGSKSHRERLIAANTNMSTQLRALGKPTEAIDACTKAIKIARKLMRQNRTASSSHDLAWAYFTRAGPLGDIKNFDKAERHVLLAIRYYEQWDECDKGLYAEPLARAHLAAARLRKRADDERKCLLHLDRCIKIVEGIRDENASVELRALLAKAYSWQSVYGAIYGRPLPEGAALASATLYEEIVEKDGRREYRNELTMAYRSIAQIKHDNGEHEAALSQWTRCVDIRSSLVYGEGRAELSGQLSIDLVYRALCHVELCRCEEARTDLRHFEKAMMIYESNDARMNPALKAFAYKLKHNTEQQFRQCCESSPMYNR